MSSNESSGERPPMSQEAAAAYAIGSTAETTQPAVIDGCCTPAVLSVLPAESQPGLGAKFGDRSGEAPLRLFEVVLVCAIAFGGSILASAWIWLGKSPSRATAGTLSWLHLGLVELSSLALVWYVLRRRSSSFARLGLSWTRADLGWSFPLYLGGMMAFSIAYYLIYWTGFASVTGSNETARVASMLFGAKVSPLIIPFLFLNPVFEEIIVRGYIMTEIRQLTGSISAAVIVSTVIQGSYHLYQGTPLAIAEAAMFLVFSLFYAKTNRLLPVVLAHFYVDVFSVLRIWLAQA